MTFAQNPLLKPPRVSMREAAIWRDSASIRQASEITTKHLSSRPKASQNAWRLPWFSSFGNDFNYDFHVTLDEKVAPVEYNYRSRAELEAKNGPNSIEGEAHGLSVFFRMEPDVFHTYSAYARGVESVTDAYSLLDRTPYGRQEDFEDSPAGWPQRPTYG